MRLIRTAVLSAVCFATGSFIANGKWKDAGGGFLALSSDPELTEDLLRNSGATMTNDGCFPAKKDGSDHHVSDFLLAYFRHFSKPDKNNYAGIADCGVVDENTCELVFGQRNVEGKKGASWHLHFEIDGATGNIKPASFECWK